MQQQCGLARRGRALVRRTADPDDRGPSVNVGKIPAAARRRRRVELVAVLGQARRGVEVVVGAERDDQHVSVVDSGVGGNAPGLGIDRRDRLPQDAHARHRDVAYTETDRVRRRPAEHHIEFREAEDEPLALVDQRHVDSPPTASESIVLSSRPPNPAPRTRPAAHPATIYSRSLRLAAVSRAVSDLRATVRRLTSLICSISLM